MNCKIIRDVKKKKKEKLCTFLFVENLNRGLSSQMVTEKLKVHNER